MLKNSYISSRGDCIKVMARGLGGMVQDPSEEIDIEILLESIFDEREAQALREAMEKLLKNDPTQKTLSLIGNKIGEAKLKVLVKILNKSCYLQKLHLYAAFIGDSGAQILSEAFKENESLIELELGLNKIGAVGIHALAKTIQHNHVLRRLFLSFNQIGDSGAQALTTLLEKNSVLKQLYLNENHITSKGAKALAEGLEKNQSLTVLDLGVNPLKNEGVIALAKALEKNQTLQELNLSHNQMSDQGVIALAKALENNETLRRLNLIYNKITEEGIQAMSTALEHNTTLLYMEGIDTHRIKIKSLLENNQLIADTFLEQIKQAKDFIQSHRHREVVNLQDLNQLKNVIQDWNKNAKNFISALEDIAQDSERTGLNKGHKKTIENIRENLTNRLYHLFFNAFEDKLALLSSRYFSKESSEKRNTALGRILYKIWTTFFGSECPDWLNDYREKLTTFQLLLDVAEGKLNYDLKKECNDPLSLFYRAFQYCTASGEMSKIKDCPKLLFTKKKSNKNGDNSVPKKN